jgi:hypothetical protein
MRNVDVNPLNFRDPEKSAPVGWSKALRLAMMIR